ncbi:RHS repeat-associated core domain-containing protein [Stenotrophomonas sp. 278]|uniref:RHS repeat-associated core domain-containing protein n=1 Tax=Stenotrophomonas sp. 278 TaxID=2479851 RepID=UPI001C8B45DA|nr:RHS repeat-associated core domain-containing protein [Stenotrophomonas sp. 278]
MTTSMRVGFNGTLHENGSHWQLLGNGQRAFNPLLMRFHSPDRLSPFGRGGINAYAYCAGDPVNLADPSGQSWIPAMVMALGAIGGLGTAGVMAAANPSSGEGGDGGVNPWIVAGVIAAVGLLAGAGMVGRQRLMRLKDSSASKSWANKAGGTSAGAPPATPQVSAVSASARPSVQPARSPSPVRPDSLFRKDDRGMRLVDMQSLPSPVRKRIVEIRDFGPHSPNPDKTLVGNGKFLDQPIVGARPDPSGLYYRRFTVLHGRDHTFGAWRIVSGSSPKGGVGVLMVTPDHDGNFVKVINWSTWKEP